MSDLISRQAAIDAMLGDKVEITNVIRALGNERDFEVLNCTCDRHAQIIKDLPPVRPQHGKWNPRYYDVGADVYVEWSCSECGYVRQKGREDGDAGEEPEADFCEKCGAKMERNEDGTDL